MVELSAEFIGQSAFGVILIAAVVELVKHEKLPSWLYPLISVALGVLIGMGLAEIRGETLLVGAIYGLAVATFTCTGYDFVKAIKPAKKKKKVKKVKAE